MTRFVVLASLVALAAATHELSGKDFDDLVFNSGKGAFIKFLAPWCGHCKTLKPDWDKLAKTFKDSPVVGIYDVDCTAGGKDLCGKHGVRGYPTIKYWTAGKKSGNDYNGGRDLSSLKSFVESTFKAQCSALTGKGCNPQELRFIEKSKDKSKEEIQADMKEKDTELKELKKEKSEAEKEHKEKLKKWKSKETALNKAVGLLKEFEKAAKKGDKKKSEL